MLASKGLGGWSISNHLAGQLVCPVTFIQEFPDRICHVHMKDAALQLDGRFGVLASHLDFGQPGRGWYFRKFLATRDNHEFVKSNPAFGRARQKVNISSI